MAKQKALYDDVVTGAGLPSQEENTENSPGASSGNTVQVTVPDTIKRKDPKDAYVEGVKDALQMNDKRTERGEKAASSREGRKEGIKEQAKEEAKDAEAAKKKLSSLAERNDIILFKAKAFFPFDLFPDQIIIDTTKVSIMYKMFFFTEQVLTINHKDITNVSVETSLFLGNVNIMYVPSTDTASAIKPPVAKISLLLRHDAVRAHNILRGITIAMNENVDLLKIPPQELAATIEKFGDSKAPL